MNRAVNSSFKRKWLIIMATLIMCVGLGITQASAAVAVSSVKNNFTMINGTGGLTGGTNDVVFTWDGSTKTSVVSSLQVSNATLVSSCPFFGLTWAAHDVAVYGPGTYTIYDACPAAGPGCGTGNAVTFTVGTGQLGAHMLFDWGGTTDIDVIDVWVPNAAFSPSSMCSDALNCGGQTTCSSNPAATVWSWMSSDWDGDGFNSAGMTDGPFVGFNANFNMNIIGTENNNFTMLDPAGSLVGGTNDVVFIWNGTKKTSVAASGQVSNATLSSTCLLFSLPWAAHDVAVYGPGTYTIYDGCPAGSPGCGTGNAVTFTVVAGQLGVHMLIDFSSSTDMDVVDVWAPNAVFGASPMCADAGNCGGQATCGANPATKVWDWMSTDWDGDGINGYPMTDGVFATFNANFNVMGNYCIVAAECNDNNPCTDDACVGSLCVHTNNTLSCDDNNACTINDTCSGGVCSGVLNCDDNNVCTIDGCTDNACTHTTKNCNDGNACTTDTCNTATGCVFPTITCNDNNICTTDSCNTATGCVFTPTVPASCNDNNACTTDGCTNNACTHVTITCNDNNACTGPDSCNTATGCVFPTITCNDNNACSTDTCNTATGCVFTPLVCNDNNTCTTNSCNTVTGCEFTPIVCDDNDACTTDTCDTTTGCVYTPISCNDNSACTTDSCNTSTGCVYTSISCNDNNICTTDTCDTATGCVFTQKTCPPAQSCDPTDGVCKACISDVQCNDSDACTTDTCNTASGCIHTPIVCNDNNACTTDTCDTTTGCVFTPIVCNDNNTCTTDTCNTATGCMFTPPGTCTVYTTNNNFTMLNPDGVTSGGTNDVVFNWDGTLKTSVAVSGQNSNAFITSNCLFFGDTWSAHDVAIYGPGTYTVNPCCPAGSPGCIATCVDNNSNPILPITFTVGAGQLGTHMLFDYFGGNNNIDVVDLWVSEAAFEPLFMCADADNCGGQATCGANPDTKIWNWMSSDWDGDGINGAPMTEGLEIGFSVNFNVMGIPPNACADEATRCDDNNLCTVDSCSTASGGCAHAAKCDDNNACTTDFCDTAGGCTHAAVVCNSNDVCATAVCDTEIGCLLTEKCDDNNVCTADLCDSASGECTYAPIVCDDNNICTIDTCNTAAGCIHTPSCAIDGDLNGAGGITVDDALMALQIVEGIITPTASQTIHGDVAPLVNGVPQPDGKITIGDVVVILRKAVGLVNF